MKRHAIQVAAKTLLVSLPSEWVSANKVKKGDELDVKVHATSVVISPVGSHALQKVFLDSRGLNERTLRWWFSSIHKQGYRELEVIYDSPKVVRLAEELVRDLFVGFAIVSETKDTLIVQQVAADADDQFDVMMRRAFLVTLSLAEGFADAFKKGDATELQRIVLLEKTNNQYTNYCMRLINQGDVPDPIFNYVILWNLEKIADEYKYMGKKLLEKIWSPKEALFAREVATLLRGYYECLYHGDIGMLNHLAIKRERLEQDLIKILHKVPSRNGDVVHHLLNVISRSGDFCASFISVRKMIK